MCISESDASFVIWNIWITASFVQGVVFHNKGGSFCRGGSTIGRKKKRSCRNVGTATDRHRSPRDQSFVERAIKAEPLPPPLPSVKAAPPSSSSSHLLTYALNQGRTVSCVGSHRAEVQRGPANLPLSDCSMTETTVVLMSTATLRHTH